MALSNGLQLTLGGDPYLFRVRYGHGRPGNPHILKRLRSGDATYREMLARMAMHRSSLAKIATERAAVDLDDEPHWNNSFFSGLDAASLYTLIAALRPSAYFEIGSGNSTRFAYRAIRDHGINTQIITLDPQPRADIDRISTHCMRQRLEDFPPHALATLDAGDVLFVDNSHRCFQNSDVTAFFLDVLPLLKAGVVLGMHDIFLPDDYPPGWESRLYNEQYMLAAWLLGGGAAEVIFPAHYVATEPQFAADVANVFDDPRLAGVSRTGGIFWMVVR